MPADPLIRVARELSALAGKDRRAILVAFEPEEREALLAAMRGIPVAKPNAAGFAPEHSDWFEVLLVDGGKVTSAARAALIDATGRERDAVPQGVTSGRTLLQAASGLLAQSRVR